MKFLFTIIFCFFFLSGLQPQPADSVLVNAADTTQVALSKRDTVIVLNAQLSKLAYENKLLNLQAGPEVHPEPEKKGRPVNFIFYYLVACAAFLALLKMFFNRYLNSLFRVFMNTSIRKNQLTDQLMQDKQAAFYFNLFFLFIISAFAYLLWHRQQQPAEAVEILKWIGIFIGLAAVVYAVKAAVIAAAGWLTGFDKEARLYLMNVFMVNKVFSILVLPVLFFMAFATKGLAAAATTLACILLGIILLMRFYKGYSSLLKLRLNSFHFFLCFIGLELLPTMLLIKALIVFSANNSNFAPHFP